MTTTNRILILILAFFFLLFLACLNESEVKATESSQFEQELFILTNKERNILLAQNDCLSNIAAERAKYLVENNIWSHYSSDGTTPWDFVKKCGRYEYAGENLMKGFSNPTEANKELMNSELHKKNIVNPNFGQIGIGCYKNICVELFKN